MYRSSGDVEYAVGQKVVRAGTINGWPVIEFEDGSNLTFTSEFGSDPVAVEYRPELHPGDWDER